MSSVSFYADDVLLGTASEAPFELQWTPETEGEKSLSAKVTDADGNTQDSAITTLYVGNRMPTVTLTSHTNYDAVDLGSAGSNSGRGLGRGRRCFTYRFLCQRRPDWDG